MFQFHDNWLPSQVILDVAAGASSFVPECGRRGIEAMAVDPLYTATADALLQRGLGEIAESTEKLAKLEHEYDWTYYGDLAQHRALRERSLGTFVEAYRQERGRFLAGSLPSLPVPDDTFTLVLCNHFLFLYHDQFSVNFHRQAIRDLIRVCQPGGEVRIYPLATLARQPYPGLAAVESEIVAAGATSERVETSFRFLTGGTEFLRIRKPLGGL